MFGEFTSETTWARWFSFQKVNDYRLIFLEHTQVQSDDLFLLGSFDSLHHSEDQSISSIKTVCIKLTTVIFHYAFTVHGIRGKNSPAISDIENCCLVSFILGQPGWRFINFMDLLKKPALIFCIAFLFVIFIVFFNHHRYHHHHFYPFVCQRGSLGYCLWLFLLYEYVFFRL